MPLAAAKNPAVAFSHIVKSDGSVVTTVAAFTVIAAAVVVAVPQEFVNTARYWLPFCAVAVVNDKVVDVAPLILLNVAPPSVLNCHCTVGAGGPLAAAVKVTLLPEHI